MQFSLESDSPCPLHALPLLDLPQDRRRRGLWHQPLGGDAHSLRVRGKKHVSRYHAVMREPGQRPKRSKAFRHFCAECGGPLWLWDPRWPDMVYPNASAIDTPLPRPPEVVEASLENVAPWVDVPRGKGHRHCETWPEESLHDWHKRHGLLA